MVAYCCSGQAGNAAEHRSGAAALLQCAAAPVLRCFVWQQIFTVGMGTGQGSSKWQEL